MWQLWLDLKSNTNTKQGGHLRLRDFNSWVNQISLQLFNEKFQAWEKDQMVVDDLSRPFLESNPYPTNKTLLNHSILDYPKNYAYFSSARIFKTPDEKVVKGCEEECKEGEEQEPKESVLANVCEVNATKVDNARWGSVCSNTIVPPTLNRVFITQYEKGFKVAPKEVGYITLDYLRFPKKAELAFLPGANQVYDPSKTVDLEWSDTVRNEFLARLEVAYYTFIRELAMYQTGIAKKETTV